MHIFVNNYIPGEFDEAVHLSPHAIAMSTSSALKKASKYAGQECFPYHLPHFVVKLD